MGIAGDKSRQGAYTNLEDVVLCEAWMEIGQDPICGVEQKWDILEEDYQLHPRAQEKLG
jgi:hypothetical protein